MILHIGARIIVVDNRQEVLDEAVAFGVNPSDVVPVGKPVAEFVSEHRLVVDTTLDFVGKGVTFQMAQDTVRHAGAIVMIGVMDHRFMLDNMIAIMKQLTILFSYGGNWSELVASLDTVANGLIKPQAISGKLEHFPEMLQRLDDGLIKSPVALCRIYRACQSGRYTESSQPDHQTAHLEQRLK